MLGPSLNNIENIHATYVQLYIDVKIEELYQGRVGALHPGGGGVWEPSRLRGLQAVPGLLCLHWTPQHSHVGPGENDLHFIYNHQHHHHYDNNSC